MSCIHFILLESASLSSSFLLPSLINHSNDVVECLLLSSFVVDINNVLHFIVRTHEDTGLVVDRLWDDLHHALHLGVDGLSTSCCLC